MVVDEGVGVAVGEGWEEFEGSGGGVESKGCVASIFVGERFEGAPDVTRERVGEEDSIDNTSEVGWPEEYMVTKNLEEEVKEGMRWRREGREGEGGGGGGEGGGGGGEERGWRRGGEGVGERRWKRRGRKGWGRREE